jgi:alanine dehydrogenase
MSPATVLTAAAAAVFISALTKSRRRILEDMSAWKVSTRYDSFEVLTNKLKAAVKQVDNSAAEVEVALKGLIAA